MFRMSHDAVDFFFADFTAAGVIVAGEEYSLGYFAAEALEREMPRSLAAISALRNSGSWS